MTGRVRLTRRGRRVLCALWLAVAVWLLWATYGDYQACVAAGYGFGVC